MTIGSNRIVSRKTCRIFNNKLISPFSRSLNCVFAVSLIFNALSFSSSETTARLSSTTRCSISRFSAVNPNRYFFFFSPRSVLLPLSEPSFVTATLEA